jgi:TolA-binding protein
MNAFNETPAPVELSPQASKALENFSFGQKKSSLAKNPKVFSQDLEPPGGGEEYALRSIVQDLFLQKNWDSCRNALISYLNLPRSSASEARARFYLGQCYYFLEQPRESLFEFLSAQDMYPAESAEWIQASLKALVE